mgnify:FL=1
MTKYLLREYYELCDGNTCIDMLTEAEKKDMKEHGAMYLVGIMQKCNVKNGNNRVYSEEVLRREMENYQRVVEDNRALGELDHPDSSIVNLANVSHMVTSVWWDGDAVMGKVKVLDTPSGKILKSLVDSGCKMGISSRGMGSVATTQTVDGPVSQVQDDFQLICFDFVSEPSTPGAFMMMKESKETNVYNKQDNVFRSLNNILWRHRNENN